MLPKVFKNEEEKKGALFEIHWTVVSRKAPCRKWIFKKKQFFPQYAR